MREDCVSERVKSGRSESVNEGLVGLGGVSVMTAEKRDNDSESDIGRRANEGVG